MPEIENILVVLFTGMLLTAIVFRATQNRRRMKPLMAAAVDRFKKERLVTAGEVAIPLAKLREVRAEGAQLRYVRSDGPDIILGHDVAGPIEIAVLKEMGASIVSIFAIKGPQGTTIWRPPSDDDISPG